MGDNGHKGQGNVSLPRNYEIKEHVSWSEVGILTWCSKKLWSHENSNLGFKEIMKRENHGISCRGYRGPGKMDRGQENGGHGNGEEGNGGRGQKRTSKRRQRGQGMGGIGGNG